MDDNAKQELIHELNGVIKLSESIGALLDKTSAESRTEFAQLTEDRDRAVRRIRELLDI